MDHIDSKILELLKVNARATVSQISLAVNLSVPAVSERVKKLEKSHVIEGYIAKISRNALGYKLLAMVQVNIDQSAHIAEFRESILGFPEIIECHHVAGEYDYLLKVLVQDTAALEVFLSEKLKTVVGVQKSNTLIVLSTLKESMNR